MHSLRVLDKRQSGNLSFVGCTTGRYDLPKTSPLPMTPIILLLCPSFLSSDGCCHLLDFILLLLTSTVVGSRRCSLISNVCSNSTAICCKRYIQVQFLSYKPVFSTTNHEKMSSLRNAEIILTSSHDLFASILNVKSPSCSAMLLPCHPNSCSCWATINLLLQVTTKLLLLGLLLPKKATTKDSKAGKLVESYDKGITNIEEGLLSFYFFSFFIYLCIYFKGGTAELTGPPFLEVPFLDHI